MSSESKKNPFEDEFADKPSGETNQKNAVGAAKKDSNPYESEFGMLPEAAGEARAGMGFAGTGSGLYGTGVQGAVEGLGNRDNEIAKLILEEQAKKQKEQLNKNLINLGVFGAGAAYGGYSGAKRPLADTGYILRKMENLYNLPEGALSEVAAAQNPSKPPTLNDAANAVAERINARTAKAPVTPAATTVTTDAAGAPVATNNLLNPGERATAIFNYARTYGLSPTQAAKAIDTTKQQSGVHDILQNELRPGILKTREVFPMGVTPADESSIIEKPITYNTRVEAPSVWRRERAFGPPPWAGAAPNPNVVTDVLPRAPSTPKTAPTSPLPANPQPAPVSSALPTVDPAVLSNAANKAQTLQRGVNIGSGAIGGGLTALQAYQMAKNAYHKIYPTWEEYLSLMGGPAMMTGSKALGTIGTLAQFPYAYKKFMEENPTGEADLNQYLPASMQSRKP
jgi:hypothetical protein